MKSNIIDDVTKRSEQSYLRSIEQRLKSRNMTEGERKQTAIAVLRCKLETRDIPSLKQVLAMTLEQLLEILQYCPESELYY